MIVRFPKLFRYWPWKSALGEKSEILEISFTKKEPFYVNVLLSMNGDKKIITKRYLALQVPDPF